MSSSIAPTNGGRLFGDLLRGLSGPSGPESRSLGLVGPGVHPPQPPEHCLRLCLGGSVDAIPRRGCALLAGAARGEIPADALRNGRCPAGCAVAARSVRVNGEPAVLLTVNGELPGPAVAGADLLGQLDRAQELVQRVDELLAENAGFANEVLQNYEQLNLIFDLTREIAQITESRAIERLLMQRLARLLVGHGAGVCSAEGEWRAAVADESAAVAPAALEAIVAQVKAQRQVQVGTAGNAAVIAGPLARLDGRVDVACVLRAPGAAPFGAGDMLLLESLLTFGGQILSNNTLHERLRQMSLEVVRALVAAIDKKDHYTSGHSERGGFLTRLTAQELGCSPAEQQTMEWAGLLHDVGKIGVPEEILCKPGKLTPEEFEVIKQHPRMGYEILRPIASFELVLDGVLYHHEYPDGTGYPAGLRGDAIPLVARIIHVVDTFDALTSTRSYRQAYPIERALEVIRAEMGTRIDPEAAEAFFRAFERYRREQPEDFHVRFGALRGGTVEASP